jgi:hypothetical protein
VRKRTSIEVKHAKEFLNRLNISRRRERKNAAHEMELWIGQRKPYDGQGTVGQQKYTCLD